MFDEYEQCQGVVLRQIIVGMKTAICISPFQREGRVNAFVLNQRVGVFVKYSKRRLSPWSFTFHVDQDVDLKKLEETYEASFIAFVCGGDGLVTIKLTQLHELMDFDESDQAWIRITRKRRSQYSLSGNKAELPNKLAHGTAPIHEALKKI